MTAEVEPMRQAAAGQLSYEREQEKREPRKTTLMPACSVHLRNSVRLSAYSAQLGTNPG
jgi:hypothetical protein